MTLTGDEAKKFMAEELERTRLEHAEQLARAKAEAAVRGKEPFDLEKLETMCDTTSDGVLAPLEQRHAEFERKYYVGFPDVVTLADFAREIEKLNRW